jgi:hypothetical protein
VARGQDVFNEGREALERWRPSHDDQMLGLLDGEKCPPSMRRRLPAGEAEAGPPGKPAERNHATEAQKTKT